MNLQDMKDRLTFVIGIVGCHAENIKKDEAFHLLGEEAKLALDKIEQDVDRLKPVLEHLNGK